MSRVDFAVAAGISVETVELINSGGAVVQSEEDIEAASVASTIWGWSSLPSPTGWEESIRPKLTRQDIRQIARLEGEGGLVGSMFPDLKYLQWTRFFVGMIAERNQAEIRLTLNRLNRQGGRTIRAVDREPAARCVARVRTAG